MTLIRLLLAESRVDYRKVVLMLLVSALSTTLLLALVIKAAQGNGEDGTLVLAALFLIGILGFTTSQRYAMRTVAEDVEMMIHRLRLRVMARVRDADLTALRRVGRAPVHAALTRDTQTVSNGLPMLVLGVEQILVLICVALYLAFLSPLAFAMTAAFSAFAVVVHVIRLRRIRRQSEDIERQQTRLFEGLRGLLDGFKEVTLNVARGDSVARDLTAASAAARDRTIAVRRSWSGEFVGTQLLLFVLLGLMVFAVPLFTTDYHDVIVPTTIGVLFMVGPLGALLKSIPTINQIAASLRAIHALEARLRRAEGDAPDEESETLPAADAPARLDLDGLRFAFRDSRGRVTFALGPVSARFRAGEVTVITGGNGSGKSTLFQLMTGLVHPRRGKLRVDGEPVRTAQYAAYRDRVSAVFADNHLFRRLYGLERVPAERVAEVLAWLELTGKTELVDGAFTTTELSAGQRKRLALAVAILEETPILMLDEWAADQDPVFRRRFYEELLPTLRREGRMVICITHDERYFHVADRVYHMADGKMKHVRG